FGTDLFGCRCSTDRIRVRVVAGRDPSRGIQRSHAESLGPGVETTETVGSHYTSARLDLACAVLACAVPDCLLLLAEDHESDHPRRGAGVHLFRVGLVAADLLESELRCGLTIDLPAGNPQDLARTDHIALTLVTRGLAVEHAQSVHARDHQNP